MGKSAKKSSSDKKIVIEKRKEILNIITAALTEDHPIHVELSNETLRFYSKFKSKTKLKKELKDKNFIAIDVLDPAIGNIRIRRSKKVFLTFFITHYMIDAKVKLLKITDDHTIRLSIPKKIRLNKQQRTSVRIDVKEKWNIKASVSRPSGISFPAKVLDISTGGLEFQSLDVIPSLWENAKVYINFAWASQDLKVEANAQLIDAYLKEGIQTYRARFLFDTHETAEGMDLFVAALQREQLKDHAETFGEES
ncbi:MAG: hypothetical protein HQL71_09195 [Magnetococcales bacterium]|nr:hypothetical protein [Magnetococcales bacterium]